MAKMTVAQAKAKLKALELASARADKAADKAYQTLVTQSPRLEAIVWGTAIALSLLIQSGIV